MTLQLRADLGVAHSKLSAISAVTIPAIAPVETRSILEAVVELRDQRDAALRDAQGWRIVAREMAAVLRELADRATEEARRGA